jgi:hypothetical protein
MSYRWSAALGAVMMVALVTGCGDAGSSESTTSMIPSGVPENAQVATISASVDADTIRVAIAAGTGSTPPAAVEVSVIGVLRPASAECLAAESDAFAEHELPTGATVYLVADAQDTGPDGTLQRYVWDSDGDLYNDTLVRQGFATAAPTPPNERFRDQLSAAESEAKAAGRGVWACPVPPTTAPATMPEDTTPRTTRVPTTSPTVTAPPATEPVPVGRTVFLGETFSVGVGEPVYVVAESLAVTFTSVVSDNRCPPGVQCIVAGNATIAVTMAKSGMPSATLSLNTDDGPTSGQYGRYTVELTLLTSGTPTIARLRVT